MDRTVDTHYYLATYTGTGEFYTGLTPDSRVRVREEVVTYTSPADGVRRAHVSLYAQRIEGSAWLCLYDRIDNLADITPEA
jgi:hypothetical protein